MVPLCDGQQGDEAPLPGPICLAFSGAGLHGFYFNGICQYINEQDITVNELKFFD